MEPAYPRLEGNSINSQSANFSVPNGHRPEERAAALLPSMPGLGQPVPSPEWHDALENQEVGPVSAMAGPAEELAEPEWHDALENQEVGPVPPMVGPAEDLVEPEWHDALENLEVDPFPFGDPSILPSLQLSFEGWSDWLLEWFEDMVS